MAETANLNTYVSKVTVQAEHLQQWLELNVLRTSSIFKRPIVLRK